MLHRYIKLTIDPATAQGWVKNNAGQWLYYKDGKTLIGWWDIGSGNARKTYYFDTNGSMSAGKWLQIDGKWYYFNADGSLTRDTVIDGYEIDENGASKSNYRTRIQSKGRNRHWLAPLLFPYSACSSEIVLMIP